MIPFERAILVGALPRCWENVLGYTLPAWLSFATHLQCDFDAVSAACSLPWNNGPVEGHINRLKMLNAPRFTPISPLRFRLIADSAFSPLHFI